jgi:hypothetical protein
MHVRQEIENRLKQLKAEYATGKLELAELQTKEATLKQTLERIGLAIKELEQKLETANP